MIFADDFYCTELCEIRSMLPTSLDHLQERERDWQRPGQVRTYPDHQQAKCHTDFISHLRKDFERTFKKPSTSESP